MGGAKIYFLSKNAISDNLQKNVRVGHKLNMMVYVSILSSGFFDAFFYFPQLENISVKFDKIFVIFVSSFWVMQHKLVFQLGTNFQDVLLGCIL